MSEWSKTDSHLFFFLFFFTLTRFTPPPTRITATITLLQLGQKKKTNLSRAKWLVSAHHAATGCIHKALLKRHYSNLSVPPKSINQSWGDSTPQSHGAGGICPPADRECASYVNRGRCGSTWLAWKLHIREEVERPQMLFLQMQEGRCSPHSPRVWFCCRAGRDRHMHVVCCFPVTSPDTEMTHWACIAQFPGCWSLGKQHFGWIWN